MNRRYFIEVIRWPYLDVINELKQLYRYRHMDMALLMISSSCNSCIYTPRQIFRPFDIIIHRKHFVSGIQIFKQARDWSIPSWVRIHRQERRNGTFLPQTLRKNDKNGSSCEMPQEQTWRVEVRQKASQLTNKRQQTINFIFTIWVEAVICSPERYLIHREKFHQGVDHVLRLDGSGWQVQEIVKVRNKLSNILVAYFFTQGKSGGHPTKST